MKSTAKMLLVNVALVSLFLNAPRANAFYNPQTGRWLSRDPIGEPGGPNLSSFVHNAPIDTLDTLGAAPWRPGQVIKVEYQQGGSGTITVTAPTSAADRDLGLKAMCLVRMLLGGGIYYYPVWTDTYWGTFAGNTDVHGATYEKAIFLDVFAKPNSETELARMMEFGITLAHEADHYHTGSQDGTPGEPAVRIDNPARAAAAKARSQRIYCKACDRHKPEWWITNLMEDHACNCDINLGAAR